MLPWVVVVAEIVKGGGGENGVWMVVVVVVDVSHMVREGGEGGTEGRGTGRVGVLPRVRWG